jgi:hypothetical protein
MGHLRRQWNLSHRKAMALSLRKERYGRQSLAPQKDKFMNSKPSGQIVGLRAVEKTGKVRLEAC